METVIFDPKETLGILDLRLIDYFKLQQGVLQQNLSKYYRFKSTDKIFHLENCTVIYGIYNSDTLEKLITTVHKMHNTTTWNGNVFAS